MGRDSTKVILPITDPYVAHHGSLGSFAMVYALDVGAVTGIIARLRAVPGVELVLAREDACRRFELPADRTGDVVICATAGPHVGTAPGDRPICRCSRAVALARRFAERESADAVQPPPPGL